VQDETVALAQKMYTERVGSVLHHVWDVQTDKGRWWVITDPTNLYSQDKFPQLDLALTFHVGLCIRIPRAHQPVVDELTLTPFAAAYRELSDAQTAFERSETERDFQGVGARCREALLTMIHAAQPHLAAPEGAEMPKRSDFRAWCDLIAGSLFGGEANEKRRELLKAMANSAWTFTNWLTHARGANHADAESAIAVSELAVSFLTSSLIRTLRGVPDKCPNCGSSRVSYERGVGRDDDSNIYERAACGQCEWRGAAVLVASPDHRDCTIPTVALKDMPPRSG
jgi:hypothetical protein